MEAIEEIVDSVFKVVCIFAARLDVNVEVDDSEDLLEVGCDDVAELLLSPELVECWLSKKADQNVCSCRLVTVVVKVIAVDHITEGVRVFCIFV